jgi:hypothetical protein
MAKKPTVVYGGPYADETDAITLESSKETPDYDGLISDWKTVSQGAVDYIASLKKPLVIPVGVFVNNVEVDYDKVDNTLPKTADFDRDRETLGEGDLVEDTDKTNTNGAGQSEIDLENL